MSDLEGVEGVEAFAVDWPDTDADDAFPESFFGNFILGINPDDALGVGVAAVTVVGTLGVSATLIGVGVAGLFASTSTSRLLTFFGAQLAIVDAGVVVAAEAVLPVDKEGAIQDAYPETLKLVGST